MQINKNKMFGGCQKFCRKHAVGTQKIVVSSGTTSANHLAMIIIPHLHDRIRRSEEL